MKTKCFEYQAFAGYMITLTQTGIDRFTVQYGKQVKSNLTYAQAAAELGACIMHSRACDGVLDNREPGEDE